VAHAEPLTDFVTYRYPANLRRRYERLKRFPKNYLVFADAMCSFNPVYGQGMTVAAQEAALLQACLRDGDADLARRFFKAAKAAIDIPWDIAVGNDLAASASERCARTKSAFHQLVHRQAAHGGASRCRAGECVPEGG
jgi:2-polyprenyl-6-methoxyphenol hydroxylase-like FAD-dependent oxidoreductase